MEKPEPWLVEAALRRAGEFAQQLRSCVDGTAPVPNLTWTVSDLGQHVASLPRYWRGQNEAGALFDRPTDFGAFSDEARRVVTETEPSKLADLLVSEFESLFRELDQSAGQRWLYGRQITATNALGMTLNEVIQHGQDLAAVTGADAPKFDRREANVAVDAMMVATPAFIDEMKAAAQPDGVYHVKFRGGKDYTWTKTGGELVIGEGSPDKPDAHLNADPAAFLMTSLGRLGQVQAALTGKMVAYGRRPWRFFGLGQMAIDGV